MTPSSGLFRHLLTHGIHINENKIHFKINVAVLASFSIAEIKIANAI